MENKVVVAVDGMGGDNAPIEIVKGCIDALNINDRLAIKIVGQEAIINRELAGYTYDKNRLEVINADEVIDCNEPPVNAIRRKKNSSIVVGLNLVKHGEAEAFLSAGSTGALLVGGQTIIGRIKGVDRAPIGAIIPTIKGVSLLIDSGANVDARSNHLVQFAKMGSVYYEYFVGKKNPTVAIVNVGLEEEKGNQLVKETYPLLKKLKDINFIGSIEAREIPAGYADVIVCEAFVGNVILKLYEGVSNALLTVIKKGFMSNLKTKIGALLVKPALKKSLKGLRADEYGGAPLLGLKGLVVKTHGSAKAKEVTTSLIQCVKFSEEKINEKISEQFLIADSWEE